MLIDFDAVIIFFVGMYAIAKLAGFVTRRSIFDASLRIELARFLLGLYIMALLGITLFPIELPPMQMDAGFAEYVNFQLLSFLKEGWSMSSVMQVLGNILLFVPAYPLAVLSGMSEKRWYQALLVIAAFSLSIETIQFVENVTGLSGFFGRVTDVNDLFLNTLGGMIGFAVIWMYKRYIIEKREQHED